jgi:dTDP-glucose pyrophosphorylase
MAENQKVVILARGLGTRMRKTDESAALNQDQKAAAGAGIKAMIPIGRPFLDYVLSGLADAGYCQVCLVIGPEHGVIRDYYTIQAPPKRVRISFAIQEKPLGTADAVLAAKEFAGDDLFLMINSDNYYPVPALQSIRLSDRPAAALFDRESLISENNEDRVLKFAVAALDNDGFIEHIYEKPSEETVRLLGDPVYVSMNCWLFSPDIFHACRSIRPSARGELELTDAVQYAADSMKLRHKAMIFRGPVLDLSSQIDISAVAGKLRGVVANP